MDGGCLYLIGLGLGSEDDITVAGLAAVQRCSIVYLEHYTSILGASTQVLEQRYQRPVRLAPREMVEGEQNEILAAARSGLQVAVLVVGDPLSATTHMDLHWRAVEQGIRVKVIHNTSIMTAVAITGLQLYRFGQTVSITFPEGTVLPRSTYDKIASNVAVGHIHTLCLCDIKVREQTVEDMIKKNNVFQPPRFMTSMQAAQCLLKMEEAFQQGVCGPNIKAFAVARLGQDNQRIVSGTLAQLANVDLGPPLHSLVLCGAMHPEEEAWWNHYSVS